MLRFLADENLNRNIVRGLRRVENVDILPAQDAGLAGSDDPTILDWAAAESRIVVSHDVNTLVQLAWQRVVDSVVMPGVIIVPPACATADVIADLLLINRVCNPDEFAGKVWYLPLR